MHLTTILLFFVFIYLFFHFELLRLLLAVVLDCAIFLYDFFASSSWCCRSCNRCIRVCGFFNYFFVSSINITFSFICNSSRWTYGYIEGAFDLFLIFSFLSLVHWNRSSYMRMLMRTCVCVCPRIRLRKQNYLFFASSLAELQTYRNQYAKMKHKQRRTD